MYILHVDYILCTASKKMNIASASVMMIANFLHCLYMLHNTERKFCKIKA